MPDATRPPGFNEFLWNSLPPEARNRAASEAAAQGVSLDNYIGRNTSSGGFTSGFHGGWGAGGGNVAGIPGLSYPTFRRGVLAGALGSVGAGLAGAGGAGGGYAGETAAGAGGHSLGGFGAAAGVGGGASAVGSATGTAGGGGMWEAILKNVIGTGLGSVLNRQQVPGKDLSRAPFESGDLQRYLPPELRAGETGPLIGAGISGIGELLRNPGGLSPNVLDAIRPRLAEESQTIAQNYRGIQSNQAGAAARGNLPVSIKGALQSALDVAQERAQRGARNEALTQSDTMRRADLERVFQILDAILQFQQAGRGGATAGLGAGTALESQKTAAMMALIGNLLNSGANGGSRQSSGYQGDTYV